MQKALLFPTDGLCLDSPFKKKVHVQNIQIRTEHSKMIHYRLSVKDRENSVFYCLMNDFGGSSRLGSVSCLFFI